MHPQAKAQRAATRRGPGARRGELFRDRGGRLGPGQVDIGMLRRDVDAGAGGAAEPQRRVRALHTVEGEPPALGGEVAAAEIHHLAAEQAAPDGQEFMRLLIAVVMREVHPVHRELGRVAAGDDIQQQAAVADTVQCRGLPGGQRRGQDARTQRHQQAQPFREWSDRRGVGPAVLAMRSGGQQDAAIAETIGGDGDLT